MNKLVVASVAALLIAFFYARSGEPRPGLLVKTKTGGKIQGIISTSRDGRDFDEWLGIPYAEPPVGDLRYSSPRPAKPWDGVRDGSQYGPICAQVMAIGTIAKFEGSEDCLYLNVHVPKLEQRTEKLPVMVWIHGGAFSASSSNEYRPEYFMDEDIVLVGINYRLGSFGFLSTGDKNIRGNMGLKDQSMALKWVNDNIESFGGDPKKITIFGESAGGASIHYQTLSLKNKGLFQKAIAQSGNAAPNWAVNTPEDAREMTLKFANSVGCTAEDSADVLKCLKSKSTEDLLQASVYFRANFYVAQPHRDGLHDRPCIETVKDEEAFITEHPLDIVSSGKALKIPLMMGALSDEGLFSSIELYKNEHSLESFEANWTTNVARAFGIPEKSKKVEEITRKIRNYYTPNWEQLSKDEKFDGYTKMFTDAYFNFHMHHVISAQRQHSTVYAYYYNRRGGWSVTSLLGEISGKWPTIIEVGLFMAKLTINRVLGIKSTDYGVSHGDDLPILFFMPGRFETPKNEQDPNYLFSKEVVKFWVDFATDEKSAKFRGVKLEPTPKTGSIQYFNINEDPKMINAPFEDRVNFLKSLGLLKPRLL